MRKKVIFRITYEESKRDDPLGAIKTKSKQGGFLCQNIG
jgi:hypothetical protein